MSSLRCSAWAVFLLVGAGGSVRAAEGEPRFSRHVEALFSRLGCNAGACHGAVKGQNGFRLSLFSAEPALDHDRLLHELGGRRINRLDPDASLLLLKATGRAPHEGGSRLAPGGRDYRLIRGWIAGGAGLDAPELSRVVRLTVTPAHRPAWAGVGYSRGVQAAFGEGSR
jgi:hypothetical protein